MNVPILSRGFAAALFGLFVSTSGFPSAAQEPYLVKDINEGAPGSLSTPEGGAVFVDLNGIVIFPADDGTNGLELWRSDGSAEGTFMVKDINGSGDAFGSLLPLNGTVIGDLVFFAADNGVDGVELWVTDGTEGGTSMVEDINGSGNGIGSPGFLQSAVANGLLVFAADDGGGNVEPWVSDGTPGGTDKLLEIEAGSTGSNPNQFVRVGGEVYFVAQTSGDWGLWKTDGTPGGTTLVKSMGAFQPSFLTAFGNLLLFRGEDLTNGKEPWISDGTEVGTTILKNIASGSDDSGAGGFLGLDGWAIFKAQATTGNLEPYITDGTEGGTMLLKDINPTGSGNPIEFTAFGDLVVFSADNGAAVDFIELWATDGTPGGTNMVKDINPTGASSPESFVAIGDTVYFAARDVVGNSELWKSDGTEEGTVLVRDLNPGSGSSGPGYLTASGGRLFFAADESNGLGREVYAIALNLPHLANISTRGQVGTGDSVMIAGIIIEGGRKRVLIRALGPTLDGFGVPNTLDDPFLTVFSGANQIGSNDDWRDTQETEIEGTGFAPPDDAEPGIILDLDPGNYTAIVSGVGGTTGNAIVEVFELD